MYFITGNQYKFKEAEAIIPDLEQLVIDLPEEQSLDGQYVIAKKFEVARQHCDSACIVEDSSLYLEGLNGFPGPLVKWMLEAVGSAGIYNLANRIHNTRATVKTILGYQESKDSEVKFFIGSVDGTLVAPSGTTNFGWDDIFQPDGSDQTFAAMGSELKPDFSMRVRAFEKLQVYLLENS